jgi:hypothetical protein
MSETEDKIIKTLLEEVAELRKERKNSKTWFSKEMIAIYSAVVAGTLAWGTQYFDALKHRESETEAKHGIVQKRRRVDRVVLSYVDRQIEEVYSTCDLYLEAVLQAMPRHQRRKAERFLETEGEGLPEEFPEMIESDLMHLHGSGIGEEAEGVSEKQIMEETHQAILEAAEEGEDVPVNAIVKKRAQEMRKR